MMQDTSCEQNNQNKMATLNSKQTLTILLDKNSSLTVGTESFSLPVHIMFRDIFFFGMISIRVNMVYIFSCNCRHV